MTTNAEVLKAFCILGIFRSLDSTVYNFIALKLRHCLVLIFFVVIETGGYNKTITLVNATIEKH